MHHYVAVIAVEHIDMVIEMMTDEVMAGLQDRDSSDGMATKPFLIVEYYSRQINVV